MAGWKETYQVLEQPASFSKEIETLTAIANTVQALKNKQRKPHYYQDVEKCLIRLAKETDLFNPTAVTNKVATLKRIANPNNPNLSLIPISTGYKQRLLDCYERFCYYNKIPFSRIELNYQAPIPLIPSTEDVKAIIDNASARYTAIFTILSETAIEQEELHQIPLTQINKEQGTISVVGTKRHLNGTYKLQDKTAQMLRNFLTYCTTDYPFPEPKAQRAAWLEARKRASIKLCKPELKQIPLKSLRNYAGAIYYLTMGKDPIDTKNFMRHIRLQQTWNYLRGIKSFSTKHSYISKVATTPEEALDLLNQGFKEESVFAQGTPNEKHLFRKINI